MVTSDGHAGRLPTVGDEDRFWALIERAWEPLGPEAASLRRRLAERSATDGVGLYEIDRWLPGFLDNLRMVSADLSSRL